ncbi:hypothetical protein COOONC_07764 [Cooperia oncophora]
MNEIHASKPSSPRTCKIVGVFGLLSNGAAMLTVRYNPVLRNSFGLLCFSHTLANFGVLLVFTLWVAPMTVM